MTTAEAIASGAIPFVHDSGGQVEIVPDADLRFRDEELLVKFNALAARPEEDLNQIRQALARHVQDYSAENYIQKMLAYL